MRLLRLGWDRRGFGIHLLIDVGNLGLGLLGLVIHDDMRYRADLKSLAALDVVFIGLDIPTERILALLDVGRWLASTIRDDHVALSHGCP